MTVSTNISSVRYEGNGVTDTFSFNGRIFTNSDLSVDIITRSTDAVVETLAPSDYTVSLVSSESAEIVVVGPKIPSASQDILIYRNISINQSLRLPTGTVFPASDVESALDRLTTIIQDSQDDGSRSLVFPKNISGITTPYLPSPEDGKLLVWDGETGNVANLSITNLIDEGFDTVFTSLIATDFLQYNGVSWVNIHNSDFPLQSIKAPTSSGIVLKNNSGTAILTIGSGGASSATFAGTLNIPDGTVSTTAKIVNGIITYAKILTSEFATLADVIAGTANKFVNAAIMKTAALIGASAETSLSGTSTTISGIPSGVRQVIIGWENASLSGTDNLRIQLGTSGGLETSGYAGAWGTNTTVSNAGNLSAGIDLILSAAANAGSGALTLTLINASTNTWAFHGAMGIHASTRASYVAGVKALSGPLERVGFLPDGANSWDGGAFTVSWKY